MAKNPNPKRPNKHVSIVAASGGGKSQVARNDVIPKSGIRALIWDVDHDHKCSRYSEWPAFFAAVKSAVKSGKPFRIGWSGDDSPEVFEKFCRTAWATLDGSVETWVICEEMADQGMGQKMPEYLRKLMVRGRKYGAVMVFTTQRCQEVPKALITQPSTRYYGLHEEQDAVYMERLTRIKAEEFEALEPLTFFKRGKGQPTAIHRTKYRDFTP